MSTYYDIHTHHMPVHPEDIVIMNTLITGQKDGQTQQQQLPRFCSIGIHPWYIENSSKQVIELESRIFCPEVVAIGESGLDKLTETPLIQQLEIFRSSALLAEKAGKPLIIHCVKAWSEIIEAKKQLKPTVPWIIHGFRGNSELAKQLIKQRFYLSFGEYFNPEAVRAAWPEYLFAETDDRNMDIRTVYAQLAGVLNVPLDLFAEQIERNVTHIFNLPLSS